MISYVKIQGKNVGTIRIVRKVQLNVLTASIKGAVNVAMATSGFYSRQVGKVHNQSLSLRRQKYVTTAARDHLYDTIDSTCIFYFRKLYQLGLCGYDTACIFYFHKQIKVTDKCKE